MLRVVRDDSSSYQQQQPLEPQPQPQDQMPMPAGQVGAKKDGCCDSLMNKLRSSLAYHVFMFTLHYVGTYVRACARALPFVPILLPS